MESETNGAKLDEARSRFVQSQELLKKLIGEKEERSRNAKDEAER
jgi:hypothetical protein